MVTLLKNASVYKKAWDKLWSVTKLVFESGI